MSKKKSKKTIGAIALSVVTYLEMFDKEKVNCYYYAKNSLTGNNNCFEGNTKTECSAALCPLKGEE